MNVLHISPDFNYVCGVSKYIYLLFKEIQSNKKKYDVNLFFITNRGDGLERLETIGIKPVSLNFKKGLKNILFLNRNLEFLKKFCRENKIDLIHTHHRYPELLSNIIKRELNIKTTTTAHSLVEGFRRFSFKSDKIIAVSKAVEKNLVEKFGISKEKIVQIYNPIDFGIFNHLDKQKVNKTLLGLSDNDILFLFVGRWADIKGVDMLIKVFEKIFKNFKNVYLVSITDIPENEKNKIQKKSKKFIFIRPLNDLSTYYEICDVVVIPSKLEPLSLVMLEAGLYRKLVVGASTGGIKEFIESHKNGILFEPNNNDSFYNSLKSVLELTKSHKEIIQNNLYEDVLKLKNIETYCDDLIGIYKELLNDNS